MRKRAQEIYSTLVSGFDAEIIFNEDGQTANVELFESGASVYTAEIDLTPFLNDGGDTYTEDLISDTAQAAVDLFESERGTLGEGATALQVEGNMRKNSWFEAKYWEDWYMSLKGSAFQDQATELLESYLDTYAPTEANPDMELDKAYQDLNTLEYNMSKLYFEKMKGDPGGQTVIIINARDKRACYGVDSLEDWLTSFAGNKLEPQAVAYAKEYLDLQAKIDNLSNTQDDKWDTRQQLQYAMEELKLQLMQAKLDQSMPEEGPEVAPKMMNDLFELAEGVEFDEPLEPMSDIPVSLYDNPGAEPTEFGVMSSRKRAEADEVTGNEPVEVQELGQLADGVDLAEVPVDEYPFNVSERIELSKEFEQVLWGGIKKKIPKGTKGKIDDLYDRAGDFYLVRFDDGALMRVPYEYLKRLSKGK